MCLRKQTANKTDGVESLASSKPRHSPFFSSCFTVKRSPSPEDPSIGDGIVISRSTDVRRRLFQPRWRPQRERGPRVNMHKTNCHASDAEGMLARQAWRICPLKTAARRSGERARREPSPRPVRQRYHYLRNQAATLRWLVLLCEILGSDWATGSRSRPPEQDLCSLPLYTLLAQGKNVKWRMKI